MGAAASDDGNTKPAASPKLGDKKTYISPWLRGFVYPDVKSPSERRSVLALALAVQESRDVARAVALSFLQSARYPDNRTDASVAPSSPRHPETGEPFDDVEPVDEESVAVQQRISRCRDAVKSASALTVRVRPELELYLEDPEKPYYSLGGLRPGSIVDLSICITAGDERLQLLLEAKAAKKPTEKEKAQQMRSVPGWDGGKVLDQPLRYAATWEDFEDDPSTSDAATCRVVGTIEMGDSYPARWEKLWRSRYVMSPRTEARVAMGGDRSWVALADIVGAVDTTKVLTQLMA